MTGRRRDAQLGRAGLGLLVLLLVLAIGTYLAWGFVHQPSGPTVTMSDASAASAHQKAEAFAQAAAQAQQTGRAVRVVETFDDAELSSLANEAAQVRGLPVEQISLHATGQGTVQGRAQAHVAGQTVPVSMEGVPVVTDGRVALNLTSTQVGAIPLPGPVSDQLTQSLRQPLELGQPITGFQDLHVSVSDGQLTVSGVAQPS
jgi:hypothetical protein